MPKVMQKRKIMGGTLSQSRVLGIAGILGIAGFSAIVGVGANSAYADASLTFTTNVAEEGLGITLSSNSATLNLAPPYNGSVFDTAPVTVTVSSNQATTYQLLMTTNPNLTSGNNTIASLDNTCADGCASSDANFVANRWGYGVGTSDVTYKPVNSGYNVVKTYTGDGNNTVLSSLTNGDNTTTVNFGVKVDYQTEPGSYTNTINFAAISDASIPTMQNLSTSACVEERPTLVVDSRDNSMYMVQRLQDGKCWMLDNLAFDIVGYLVDHNISASDFNAEDFDIENNARVDDFIEATNINEGVVDDISRAIVKSLVVGNRGSEEEGNLQPAYAQSGVAIGGMSGSFNYPRIYTNIKDTVYNKPAGSNGSGKTGVFYNYCAASAGSYCYDETASSGNATSDICPVGWRMPTGSSTGEYHVLADVYGGTSNPDGLKVALTIPLSGFILSARHDQGSTAYFWSTTRRGDNNMYGLSVHRDSINPDYYGSVRIRRDGWSVRCILR